MLFGVLLNDCSKPSKFFQSTTRPDSAKKSPVTIPLVWTVRQDLQLLATLLEDSARHGEEVCESPAEAAARILKLCGLEVGSVAFVGMMSHDLQS